VERRRRVVADREDILAPDRDAAEVVLPLDEFLKDHRLRPVPRRKPPGLVVRPDELLFRVDAIDVLPAAAGVRLEDRGQTRVLDERVPVERVLQVAQRLVRDVRDVRLVGRTTVFGTATPSSRASVHSKNFSSASHQNGSFTTTVPWSTALFRCAR